MIAQCQHRPQPRLVDVRDVAETARQVPSPFVMYFAGDLAYLPDVIAIPEASWLHLQGLECWVLDALRRKPHPTHAHLALSLEWIAKARPTRAILTNMHVDLDHATLLAELPDNVTPAHDGMVITFENIP